MLMTRPSMWFGTIAWRSEPVLMLKSVPSPALIPQRSTPDQIDVA